jgi:Tol biopolymer transport system component/predicted Ser/Thr protein kinase
VGGSTLAILAGKRLGPYEILSAIGAGGMGEVYRARDTRLERIVAVKILPDHLSDRAELRERFEREARTIASLNHPHICTLHDIGQQDGTDFLVMEYLEGETLAERLKKGPLPLDQVLQYAIEIADALDKAHRKGITHRDLKPANIMITKSCTKLLDFGLAKLRGPQAAVANLSALPTEGSGLTAQGTILGTLQYMAPEQLEGKEADARTDIFAFGVVVYEMATGKKAFEGKSQASLIAKILETDPPSMSSLQPMTPPALDRVVKTCLAKDPDDRWQSASDLRRELKWIAASRETEISAAAALNRARPQRARGLIAALACLIAIAGVGIWILKPAPSLPITRSVFSLPAGEQLAGLGQPAVALSPSGNQIVYVAIQNNLQQLYLRSMNSFEARPVPGTEGATGPFFSPDGQWIGFAAGDKIKKVPITGGPAVTLATIPTALQQFSATWGADNTIVFQGSAFGDLMRLSAAGGSPQVLTTPDRIKGEFAVRWPAFLPQEKGVLYTAIVGPAEAPLKVFDLRTSRQRALGQNAANPHYSPTGHLVYAQGGTLFAAPFDVTGLEVTGAGLPVIEGVMQSAAGGAQYSLSENGSLAYVPGSNLGVRTTLVWVDRQGKEQALPAPASSSYANPRISPDGRHAAVSNQSQVWVYDFSRDTLSRLTFVETQVGNNAWTPDGKRVVFQSGTPLNLFSQPADGSGKAERLATSQYRQAPGSWSPDGKLLAFIETSPTTGQDIWILRLSDRKAEPFLRTPANEGAPQFSPDGHWLAYASDESGRWEIYVQPYPGPGGKWQISAEGGREPVWNRNGRELFYRNGEKMMVVDIASQPNFMPGKPRILFQGRYRPTNASLPGYDVYPDGERFLMVKEGEQAASATQINIVQNWFEELKQKVPTGQK